MEDIFQASYNESGKIQVMLKYTAEMLSNRRAYKDDCTFEELHKSFVDNLVGNVTYFNNGTHYIDVYVTLDKIKKIDKSDELANFLTNDPSHYKVIIVKKATPKLIKFFENKSRAELIMNSSVMASIINCILNPKFRLLSEEEQEQIRKEYNIENNLCTIKKDDPISLYYKLQQGEIIEIDRSSISAGHAIEYKIRS